MKKGIVLCLFAALLILTLCSNSAGYGSNITGSVGANTGCASCHGSTSSIGTTVELDSAGVSVSSYIPGLSYTVKITATNATGLSLPKFGCQVSLVKATGAGTGSATIAGTWGTMPTGMSNHGIYIGHNQRLNPVSGTGSNGTVYTEVIPWTAPVAGTGSVKIYGIINAVNNNGTDDNGDKAQFATAVTITERPAAVVASVAISQTAGTNPTCQGSSVTFTATPTNGGTTPTYQWKDGATVLGTGSTLTTSALGAGPHSITCIMTSNLSGVTGSPATSSAISFTVNPTVVDSVNISASATTICAGSSVTFTAHPFNGGTPTYQWRVGSTVVGTGATFTSSTLTNGNIVTCVMTPTGSCVSPATSTSNAITMVVNPIVVDSVNISASAVTICAGTSVTFTAHPFNGGTPTYQWRVGSTVVGTGSTYTSSTLANGNVVTCIMTPTGSCVSPTTSISNAITMAVNATVTPTVHITTPSRSICPNTFTTFTATSTNGGSTPAYQWQVNGVNAGSGNDTFSSATLTNGARVTCILTSNAPCASPVSVTSNVDTMIVSGNLVATISVTGATSLCSGSADTFTAHITNGGTAPSFAWTVNGNPAGTNSSTLILPSVTSPSAVACTLTSSSSCVSPSTVTSSTVNVAITPQVTPAISIATTHTMICAGVTDSFISVVSGQGTNPTYQWFINTTPSGTGSTFTSSALANGNVVTCMLTSNAACASPTQVTSSGVTITVNPVPATTLFPSGAVTVCAGDSVTLTATGTGTYHWSNGDTTAVVTVSQANTYAVTVTGTNGCSASPPAANVTIHTVAIPTITQNGNVITASSATSYQWEVNDTILTGADTTQSITMTESGTYHVIVGDGSGCTGISLPYILVYTPDTIPHQDTTGITGIGTQPIARLYPVPNHGSFIIDMPTASDAHLAIYDIYGKEVYQTTISTQHTEVKDADLAPALYLVHITAAGRSQTIKMQVLKE